MAKIWKWPYSHLSSFLVSSCFTYAYLQYAVGQKFDRFCVWSPLNQKWHFAIFESCVFLQKSLFLKNAFFVQWIISLTEPWPVQEIIPLYDLFFALPPIGIRMCVCNIFSNTRTDTLQICTFLFWPPDVFYYKHKVRQWLSCRLACFFLRIPLQYKLRWLTKEKHIEFLPLQARAFFCFAVYFQVLTLRISHLDFSCTASKVGNTLRECNSLTSMTKGLLFFFFFSFTTTRNYLVAVVPRATQLLL